MNPDQWHKIRELFDAALDRPRHQRAEFLDFACGGDEAVRRRVEAMLSADEQDDLLIDRPAYKAVTIIHPATLLPDDSQSFSGEIIGDYRLIKELGRGGMGTVYLAYDMRLGRHAALKLLPSQFSSPERVRRLEREARAASALNHPHIITIYDFGQENGRQFIASEFVEGRRLRDYVNTSELTLNQILEVAIQVASALETAHAAGIIHRDIKPENIMLRPDGYAKVLDFGLAKLTDPEFGSDEPSDDNKTPVFETKTGILLGTVNYMSPEQVRFQKLDGRSDLFSLGIVLYELLTGHRPFQGETPHHTLVAIEDSEPLPLAHYAEGIPERLQVIVHRVLSKNRDERYQTARALLSDFESLQAELPHNAQVKRFKAEVARGNPIGENTTPLMADHLSVTTNRGTKDTLEIAAALLTHLKPYRLIFVTMALLIVAMAYLYFGPGFSSKQPPITEKDTILLADFINTTGDGDFDGTLKQGLTVQLGQSPFINIFPEERARDTLVLMERPHDEKITRQVGREICQRRGIKVLMVSTIARLGRNYVITLEAVNSQSDELVTQQQTEAEGKEQVLQALGGAATEVRKKLGESLASIQKFNVPIEQATTASLAAFKDFTLGVELRRQGKYAESLPPFKHAVELDEQFALAHVQLGTSYRDLRNLALGNKHLERAYELRDRVSERERLEISATYFRHITGELDKRIGMTSLLTRTYPQDPYVYHLHGNSLMIAGEFAQAAAAYSSALQIDPDYSLPRVNLALALIGLDRFDEAQDVIKQGIDRGLDPSGFYKRLYLIAFFRGDSQGMDRYLQSFTGKSDEYQVRELQARGFAFAGRRGEANKSFADAAELAGARGLPAERARILANEINLNATFGLTQAAAQQAPMLLELIAKENISLEELQSSLIGELDAQPLAWTLALCGDAARSQTLADEFTRKFPQDTIHNSVWLPVIRATLELKKGNAAGQNQAAQLLPPSHQYEAALNFRPTWVRGLAYLQAKDGALAAAEFQTIIDHRGWDVLSPLWPLAHLGLARAAVLQGDVVKARRAYQDFLALWKDADADLPVLIEAKKEYEKLK
jgi:serine/threonine protein kinase/tetratricopeptide (TPR) repeat protein